MTKATYPVETLIKMCREIDHVKCIKMGTRVTPIYEHDVRLLRQECPDISLITCHDETLCVSWFPGMDGALIGFAGCVPELITTAWDVFRHPDQHSLKEAQEASNRIYPISQAIYGGGQPSGEAHARLKEALRQRGVFQSALMRKPVLPLDQGQKDWVANGLKLSQLPQVDMNQYK
jgi:4-hydroxy-tetrahydrodipicolinate synthase